MYVDILEAYLPSRHLLPPSVSATATLTSRLTPSLSQTQTVILIVDVNVKINNKYNSH